ncbi:MAG: methyltransferase domain-containing protein [Patescibacteria group bacterium]
MSHQSNPLFHKKEDIVLMFCTDVLKLKSLHLGYWEKEALTIDNLKNAQKRYSLHLLKFIPKEVKNILDIGCGIGDNALLLAKEGYNVTCISPELNQKKVFGKINNKKIKFFSSKIEDFGSHEQFDLALMSESSNYFDKNIAFQKCNKLVKKGGHILSASLFRKTDTKVYEGFHIENEWIKSAQKNGFEVVKREDITKAILPSLKLGHVLSHNYVIPIARLTHKYVMRTSQLRVKLLSLIFKKQVREINDFLSKGYLVDIFNPELFEKKARYVIYLLKKAK